MRTTLDIDDDVLTAAKHIGKRTRRTTGAVISELARKALISAAPVKRSPTKNGFEVMPAEGRVVTGELVRHLMEESEST